MTKGNMIEVFGRELEQYFDFRGSFDEISVREKADGGRYGVYLTDIKREYLTHAPNGSVIIKELSALQAENYGKLLGIWSPYLETVYGVMEKEGIYIAINEFVEAPKSLDCENRSLSLEEYVVHFGCLPERVALVLLWQLCEGIKALEKIDLTHGDISPQNILFTDAHEWDGLFWPFRNFFLDFSVKLIDFDISKKTKDSGHPVTTVLGTKSFAAPEILDYRYPSDRVDIYSLGCILHYMLTGRSPKELESGKRRISRGACRIIEGCTAGYSARYHNVSRLQKEILRQYCVSARGKFLPLSYIPGFRSRSLWKMAVASGVYLYLGASWILAVTMDIEHFFEHFMIAIGFCLELMLVFDVFHVGNLSRKYMEYRQNFPPLKYAVKFLAGLSVLILLALCIG